MTTAATILEYRRQITAGGAPNLPPQLAREVLGGLTDAEAAAYRARLGLPPERRP